MDRQKNAPCTDLDLLARLEPLSSFSADELRELAGSLESANFRKDDVILGEETLAAGVHILLRGVAKITCLNTGGRRVTVALLAPGPIAEFLSSQVSQWHFRCEAYTDCRVGSLSWDQFDVITRTSSPSALRKFHESNLRQWYRFPAGRLDIRARLVFTLLQLCSTFGVRESRGTLLRIRLSQKDLADLVGATRPRITERLAELERERLLIRQGRQLILRLDRIEVSSGAAPADTGDAFAKAGAQPDLSEKHRLYAPRSRVAA